MTEYQKLTTNPLTITEGVAHKVKDVYVPLGLMERKQQSKVEVNVPPKQEPDLYKEAEITQTFEHDQFLWEVLRQKQSHKSQGKRIAIIGEPGAGKTTLLQHIADWVSSEIEQAIIIWVSLADLQGQALEEYLYTTWLNAVARKTGRSFATGEHKDDFASQFRKNQVWLLLDGLDEMFVSSGNPLEEIAVQINKGGSISQAQIVLTCRVNFWDGSSNALYEFDAYRTLNFSYPYQVELFIDRWFSAIPKEGRERGQRLCTTLKQQSSKRIQDLVKNPLRLTLLCLNWQSREGNLPDTKAVLYEQFVTDFYEWKKGLFSTTRRQREQLNTMLGELAREAIDKEVIGFRLQQEFVCKYLGEPDDSSSLFWLVLQLGWLNKIGIDVENRREPVYAFFHPTFQEYFAALAIDNWRFFLNHIPKNPSHPDASYRIFDSKWKQCFLLWLGRRDIIESLKEDLLYHLLNFQDRCGSFYTNQAVFLATSGLSEFKEFVGIHIIAKSIIYSRFEYIYYDEPKTSKELYKVIETHCENALVASNHPIFIDKLLEILQDNSKGNLHTSVVRILGKIASGNEPAIEQIIRWIGNDPTDCNNMIGIDTLREIGVNNEQAISLLIMQFRNRSINPYFHCIADSLVRTARGNRNAIYSLSKIVEICKEESRVGWAIETLGRIITDEEDFISEMFRLSKIIDDNNNIAKILDILSTLIKDPKQKLRILISELEIVFGDYNRQRISQNIVNHFYEYKNEETISILLDILQETKNESFRLQVAEILVEISPNNQAIAIAFVNVIKLTKDEETRKHISKILGNFSLQNEQVIQALVELLESYNEHTCWQTIDILSKIARGNQNAILALEKFINNYYHNDYVIWKAAEALWKIKPENSLAQLNLIRHLQTYPTHEKLDDKSFELIDSPPADNSIADIKFQSNLGKDVPEDTLTFCRDTDNYRLLKNLCEEDNNPKQKIKSILELIQNTQENDTLIAAIEALEEIGVQDEELVVALSHLIIVNKSYSVIKKASDTLLKLPYSKYYKLVKNLKPGLEDIVCKTNLIGYQQCLKIIWDCSQNMSYPDFFKVFVVQNNHYQGYQEPQKKD